MTFASLPRYIPKLLQEHQTHGQQKDDKNENKRSGESFPPNRFALLIVFEIPGNVAPFLLNDARLIMPVVLTTYELYNTAHPKSHLCHILKFRYPNCGLNGMKSHGS